MAMSPARVMTMEMTKASRGRSTKMAEITGSSSLGDYRRALHHLARPHLLHAIDDDRLALLETGFDDDFRLLLRTGLDAADLCLVIVAYHQYVAAGLVDLERRLRDDEARLLRPLAHQHRHELAVDELPIGIGQRAAHGDRIRLLVDLRIGVVPHPRMRV